MNRRSPGETGTDAMGDPYAGYTGPGYALSAYGNDNAFGSHGAGAGGGGGGVPLGPSTPSNMAATQTAANGVPSALAANGGTALLHQALAALAGIVPGLIARNMSGGGGGNGGAPDGLNALIQESVNRTRYQNPLFQAATQQAFMGLPTYARQGLSIGQFPPK